MNKNQQLRDYYFSWKHELDAQAIYDTLHRIENAHPRRDLFKKLAEESFHQAEIWRTKAGEAANAWSYRPGMKVRIVITLLKLIGPKRMLETLAAMKIRGLSLYRIGTEHQKIHADKLENIHSQMQHGTSLRAALFGINDGLVSNASLVFAMVGATANQHTILLAGLAGWLAGAFSMAVGEYISVKSQTDLFEHQISLERAELMAFPEEEAKELSLIYQAKGLDEATATHIATTLVKDPDKALDTLAREELGLNPDDLGSGLKAAIASFVSFSIGALIPLAPFIILEGAMAARISFAASVVSLFLIGALVSLLTGRSFFKSGLKVTALGLAAGGATYLIGHFVGA